MLSSWLWEVNNERGSLDLAPLEVKHPVVRIVGKSGCHLCEVVRKVAARVRQDVPFHLEYTNIAEDALSRVRYADRIPVVLIDGIERFAGKVTDRELRAAIKKARWRRPISRILSRLRVWRPRG